ncbi:MAG: prepilin peptidase [Planctomycetota bacterium]|nr:prepilin peptidase [Planctomycetota bacterium]
MPEVTTYNTLMMLFTLVNGLFACAFGACIGSLLNVLVYRMPLGLDVVSPPSRCPNCETRLTWRENIPIFGWLALRGKCRFCRSRISAEYPIVEAIVAAMFGLVFLKVYTDGPFMGIPFNAIAPAWGGATFATTWPTFVTILVLLSCLTAITIIDARTFQIPLILTWVPAAAALVFNLIQVALVSTRNTYQHPQFARGWDWSIATPGPHGWGWIGGSIGGMLGLGLSTLLLHKGLIKRSFHDYESWLNSLPKSEAPADGARIGADGTAVGTDASVNDPQMWLEYPHARREMVREVLFLTPCLALGYAGWTMATKLAGPWKVDIYTGIAESSVAAPLWLNVLAAVLMGYLIGGGIVWIWRILGTLMVGREALGLGDVHMMAAVGACLGWPHSILGFFAAAFVGVFWTIVGKLLTGKLQRQMPFGPYLAIGTVLVWFCQPGVERLLGMILRTGERFILP